MENNIGCSTSKMADLSESQKLNNENVGSSQGNDQGSQCSTPAEEPPDTAPNTFNEFYSEVKAIEKRDSVLTPKQQIDRLNRPGSTYFNLNPYDVLQIDPDTQMADVKKRYRQMSILVHPDKNPDDIERAQKSFDAMNKAYKTLENDEGMKRCREIVAEAESRTNEMIKHKKKQLKKENKAQVVPEDNRESYKHAVYVQTCKLFADLERMRREKETREMHERKRKAEEDAEEEEDKKMKKEWEKNFEASRTGRVDSWRSFKSGGKVKKPRGFFRPPKPKVEQR